MKHLIFPLLFLLGFSANLCAQQIVSLKDNGKWPYAHAGERLNKNELGKVLQSNPEAYQLYQGTRSSRFTSLVFSGAGGWLIGNQIGKRIAYGKGYGNNALIWGGGLALVATSLAIDSGANKRRHQAVDLYNRGLALKDTSSSVTLGLGTTSDGLGLVLNF